MDLGMWKQAVCRHSRSMEEDEQKRSRQKIPNENPGVEGTGCRGDGGPEAKTVKEGAG